MNSTGQERRSSSSSRSLRPLEDQRTFCQNPQLNKHFHSPLTDFIFQGMGSSGQLLAENVSFNIPSTSDPIKNEIRDHVPPHTCRPLWIDRLFEAIRDLNPPKITQEFVGANVVGSRHEGNVLVALRFLGLIDESGNVTNR